MWALYKAYTCERAWKAIGDKLEAPSYISRVHHRWKIEPENKEQASEILLC
jgi:hypothetical protein